MRPTGHGTLTAGATSQGRPLPEEKRQSPLGKDGARREPTMVPGKKGDPALAHLSPNSDHRMRFGKGEWPLTLRAYGVVTENLVVVGKKATGKSYLPMSWSRKGSRSIRGQS